MLTRPPYHAPALLNLECRRLDPAGHNSCCQNRCCHTPHAYIASYALTLQSPSLLCGPAVTAIALV